MIGNKISDDISVSKKSAKELQNNESEVEKKVTPKKRYIFPEERQQIIGELRLLLTKDVNF